MEEEEEEGEGEEEEDGEDEEEDNELQNYTNARNKNSEVRKIRSEGKCRSPQ